MIFILFSFAVQCILRKPVSIIVFVTILLKQLPFHGSYVDHDILRVSRWIFKESRAWNLDLPQENYLVNNEEQFRLTKARMREIM